MHSLNNIGRTVLILSLGLVFACENKGGREPAAPTFVRVDSYPEIELQPASNKLAVVSFLVEDGYHIMADDGDDPTLIYSRLLLPEHDFIEFGEPVFPDAREIQIAGSSHKLRVLDGLVQVEIPIHLKEDAPLMDHVIQGQLYYQPCNDSKCFFPRQLTFQLTVFTLAGDSVALQAAN